MKKRKKSINYLKKLPVDVLKLITEFVLEPTYKYKSYINQNKINWQELYKNSRALDLILRTNSYIIQFVYDFWIINIRTNQQINYNNLLCNPNPRIQKIVEANIFNKTITFESNNVIYYNNLFTIFNRMNNNALKKRICDETLFFKEYISACNSDIVLNFLQNNPEYINYDILSKNEHDIAIQLLNNNSIMIDWNSIIFNSNKNALDLIKEGFFSNYFEEDFDLLYNNNIDAATLIFEHFDNSYIIENINIVCQNISSNKNIIKLLDYVKDHIDKLNWFFVSQNEHAIELIEQHLDKVVWSQLSKNSSAIHILKKNINLIDIDSLFENKNLLQFYESIFQDFNILDPATPDLRMQDPATPDLRMQDPATPDLRMQDPATQDPVFESLINNLNNSDDFYHNISSNPNIFELDKDDFNNKKINYLKSINLISYENNI
jgi:hypothetical protein